MKLFAIFVAAICSTVAYADGLSMVAEPPTIDISPRPICDIMCTMQYDPVCALPNDQCGDYQTFGNACSLGVYNCQNPGKLYYQYCRGACERIGKEDQFPVFAELA